MSNCENISRALRQVLFAMSCLALVLWTLAPSNSHVPTVIQTLQEHAEMIQTHGHSHGLEEDLIWALHGHSHDVVDHDHTQVVHLPNRSGDALSETGVDWRREALSDWAPPHFRLERPPRV